MTSLRKQNGFPDSYQKVTFNLWYLTNETRYFLDFGGNCSLEASLPHKTKMMAGLISPLIQCFISLFGVISQIVKRSVLLNTKSNGGLSMTDDAIFSKCLKCKWVNSYLSERPCFKMFFDHALKMYRAIFFLSALSARVILTFPIFLLTKCAVLGLT